MRKLLLFTIFLSAASFSFAADTVSYRLKQLENWAFYGTQSPTIKVMAVNDRGISAPLDLQCAIMEYSGRAMFELYQTGVIRPKDSLAMSFAFKTLEPGFYNAVLKDAGKVVKSVNVAYEPEKISSRGHFVDEAPVSDRNFTRLLESVKEEVALMPRRFSIERNKRMSGKEKNVYDFRMVSRDDKVIKGYIAFPRGKKNLAAMVSFLPLEGKGENPLADFTARQEMVELVVYLGDRGDGEMYFRNILADAALCLEFILQRPEVDATQVFTQGTGSAAPISCVASSINGSVKASFVCSPDFSRFIDCFTPESVSENVSVPVLFGIGLQDKTVRLQEDFAVYNNLKSVKEYFIFPSVPSVERDKWRYVRDNFILRLGE